MARRDRVPRRKSHGAKNKNPKLSPFQREQKRDRLANQPPTEGKNKRDYPVKQRAIYEYLIEKERRDLEKKEARKRAAASASDSVGPAAEVEEPATKKARVEQPSPIRDKQVEGSKKQRQGAMMNCVPSLNAELKESTSTLEDRMDTRTSVILKKKEKKHAKKLLRRKEMISDKMKALESEMMVALTAKAKKKPNKRGGVSKDDANEAYERELMAMQREKARDDKIKAQEKKVQEKEAHQQAMEELRDLMGDAGAHAADDGDDDGSKQHGKKKKSISFDSGVPVDVPHKVVTSNPKKEFYQYVDVVKFGERVDAPPVFNVVPDKKAAISKLAQKLKLQEELEMAKRVHAKAAAYSGPVGIVTAGPSRHAILSGSSSGISNPEGLAERKRLASLGLAPRPTELVEDRSAQAKAKTASASEFELLRQKVMESYAKNKQVRAAAQRKAGGEGIDLKHRFPTM